MAFPPPPKPSVKQWAGGPPKAGPPKFPPPAAPAARDPNADPNAPQAPDPNAPINPDEPQQPPPVDPADPATGEGDPKMMSRAHQALARLLMDGGLSKEVDVVLMQAMQKLVEKRKGGAPEDPNADPNADPAEDQGKKAPPFGAKPDDQKQPPGAPPPKAGPPPFAKKPPPFPPK